MAGTHLKFVTSIGAAAMACLMGGQAALAGTGLRQFKDWVVGLPAGP
jgi:hypothetical protein